MPRYEYKVVPAPAKGQKSKGVKTPEGRFALSVEALLNEMAASGWEYLRAELLPSEERAGLTGTTTTWRNVLVFQRLQDEAEEYQPRVLDTPGSEAPAVVPAPTLQDLDPDDPPRLAVGATHAVQPDSAAGRQTADAENHAGTDTPPDFPARR
ncbi:DUF4177 domain-containing protein [Sedimentitalea sp. HM32M-2]|uniref:DUF4177 domain-containing protein n=1 Tax=Sedimentitalea sp. HM32M-2 TaxID=3351566 RepID=UPI00363C5C59